MQGKAEAAKVMLSSRRACRFIIPQEEDNKLADSLSRVLTLGQAFQIKCFLLWKVLKQDQVMWLIQSYVVGGISHDAMLHGFMGILEPSIYILIYIAP